MTTAVVATVSSERIALCGKMGGVVVQIFWAKHRRPASAGRRGTSICSWLACSRLVSPSVCLVERQGDQMLIHIVGAWRRWWRA